MTKDKTHAETETLADLVLSIRMQVEQLDGFFGWMLENTNTAVDHHPTWSALCDETHALLQDVERLMSVLDVVGLFPEPRPHMGADGVDFEDEIPF